MGSIMEASRKIRELVEEYFPEGNFVTNKEQVMRIINAMLEGIEKGLNLEEKI